MTKEHIFLCVILKIPFIIIISKIDMCVDRKNILEDTIKSINKFLRYPGIRRISMNIKNEEDIIIGAKNIYNESIVPIFYISNVTGEGIDKLSSFFNIIGKNAISSIWLSGILPRDVDTVMEDNKFIIGDKEYSYNKKTNELKYKLVKN